MIGRHHGQLGDSRKRIGRNFRRQRAHFLFAHAQKLGMPDLVRQIDLEPIGLIMARRIGVKIGIGPKRQSAAQFVLRVSHPLLAVDGGMAARQHKLGLPIERAQQLALPAVPDAGANGANIAHGEHQQQAQALQRLHGSCK